MPEADDQGFAMVRGIVGMVLIGVALGVGHNALQRAAGPKHGLAWIKQEVKLASLESIAEAATTDSAATDSAAAPAALDSTAHASAASDTSHAKAAAKGAKPAGGAATAKGAAAAKGTAATTPAQGAAASAAPAPAPNAAKPAADVPNVPDTREPLEAKFASVKKLYDAGLALFVDARTADEYATGHISGAVNMPFDDVFKDPDLVKKLDTHGRPVIVTYCGGGDCDLSRNLAFSLIDAGHKKVLVYLGGYPEWKDGGSAVATGTSAGTAP